jgi:hypothetical protein
MQLPDAHIFLKNDGVKADRRSASIEIPLENPAQKKATKSIPFSLVLSSLDQAEKAPKEGDDDIEDFHEKDNADEGQIDTLRQTKQQQSDIDARPPLPKITVGSEADFEGVGMADDALKSTDPHLAGEEPTTQKINLNSRHAQSFVEASFFPQIEPVRTGINTEDAVIVELGQITNFAKIAHQTSTGSSDGSISKNDLETGRAKTALQTHNQYSPIFESVPQSQDKPAKGSYSGMLSLQPSDPMLNGYKNAIANRPASDLEKSQISISALEHNQQARGHQSSGHPATASATTHAMVSDVRIATASQKHAILSNVVPQESEKVSGKSEIQNITSSLHRPVLGHPSTIEATSNSNPTSKPPTQSDLEDFRHGRGVSDNSGTSEIQEPVADENRRLTGKIRGISPQSSGLDSPIVAHSKIRQASSLTPSVATEDGSRELSVVKSRHGAQSAMVQQQTTETKSNLNLDQSHFSNALGSLDRSRTTANATSPTRYHEKSATHTSTSGEMQQAPLAAQQTGTQQTTKLAASLTTHTAVVPQPPADALSGLQLQTSLDESSENELIQVQSSDQTRGASVATNHIPVKAGIPQHIPKQLAEVIHANGNKSVDIALSPDELGRVRLSITQAESGLVVNIQAERAETLDMLRRNIGQLDQELKLMGYADPGFSFSQEGSGNDKKPDGRDSDVSIFQDHSTTPPHQSNIDDQDDLQTQSSIDIRL